MERLTLVFCLTIIDVTMRGAKLTPCRSRCIHRTCYTHHVATSDHCGHCRAPFAAFPNGVTTREQQRQQAIRDLEALLEPGAIEERITQEGRHPVYNFVVVNGIVRLPFQPFIQEFYFN